jgi:hypothetical protein
MAQRLWPALCLLLGLALTAVVLAQPPAPTAPGPTVLSSADVGFRVDYFDGRTPVGTLVVRVNGQWLEPKSVPSMMLLTPSK